MNEPGDLRPEQWDKKYALLLYALQNGPEAAEHLAVGEGLMFDREQSLQSIGVLLGEEEAKIYRALWDDERMARDQEQLYEKIARLRGRPVASSPLPMRELIKKPESDLKTKALAVVTRSLRVLMDSVQLPQSEYRKSALAMRRSQRNVDPALPMLVVKLKGQGRFQVLEIGVRLRGYALPQESDALQVFVDDLRIKDPLFVRVSDNELAVPVESLKSYKVSESSTMEFTLLADNKGIELTIHRDE